MATRLTVVFDDEELYRRIKIRAAEEGVPVKRIVEEALSAYIEGPASQARRTFTGEEILAWAEDAAAFDEDPDGPDDLSDIKHYVYGYPKRRIQPTEWAAYVESVQPSNPTSADK